MPYADPMDKRAHNRRYNAERTGGNTIRSARWRAQKRKWWRDNRAQTPVKVLVAP